jgi:cytochrome c peroxidase
MNVRRCCWLPMLCVAVMFLVASQAGCPGREEGPAKGPAGPPAEQPKAVAELPPPPLGLPPVPIPPDNPMTPEKVELGKLLYFDKRVSKDGTVSCATCHDPKMAWAEHEPTSEGVGHQFGQRNAPTVINAAYATSQFWDGRAATLEEQAVGPVGNPIEMGHSMEAVVGSFSKIPEYEKRFQEVFGTGVTEDGFAKAVAAFERTVLSGNSPYDRLTKNNEEDALSEAQKHGLELFQKAGCADCHAPPLFSNYAFYNAGVGMDKEKPDEGRKDVTGDDVDLGKFRVPALREVANTAPYFHDGSAKTLEDAVAVMAGGGLDNENLSGMLKVVREAKLTDDDQKDLVEFLNALSGEYPIIEPPELPSAE